MGVDPTRADLQEDTVFTWRFMKGLSGVLTENRINKERDDCN